MLLKRLKLYWLRWKGKDKESTKEMIDKYNPIGIVEDEIAKLKAELNELHKIRSEFRAGNIVLRNDIGYFNNLIIKNNNKIQKLEEQEVLTRDEKQSIENYEEENKKYQSEIEQRKQKKKELLKELQPIENRISGLTIQIRDYQNSLRILVAKIKILSATLKISASEKNIKISLEKLADLAKEIEQNQKK